MSNPHENDVEERGLSQTTAHFGPYRTPEEWAALRAEQDRLDAEHLASFPPGTWVI